MEQKRQIHCTATFTARCLRNKHFKCLAACYSHPYVNFLWTFVYLIALKAWNISLFASKELPLFFILFFSPGLSRLQLYLMWIPTTDPMHLHNISKVGLEFLKCLLNINPLWTTQITHCLWLLCTRDVLWL